MHVYLDIETIPGQQPGLKEKIAESITPPGNYKKPETLAKWEEEQKPDLIEEAWRKTAFHGDRGEVVCIAWAIEDDITHCVYRTPPHIEGNQNDVTEAELLGAFFMAIAGEVRTKHGRLPVFIGHNVRDFDLRFLFQRAVILGVRPPFHLPHDVRPNSEHIFDTMTAWAGWGGRISLVRLCTALDIPNKGSELDGEDIDGSKVWGLVRDGRADAVAVYCKADVERVRRVHRRMTFQECARRVAKTGRAA